MPRVLTFIIALLGLILPGLVAAQNAPPAEKRIALVIGNAGYQAGALNTAANDAGLIAQTLQASGFDVVGSRDLDQDTLRRAFRDFLEKAQASGPNTIAFIYLSGYGLQLEGENYFIPVDARIARDLDVAVEAVRISDYARPLAALRLKATILVLDAARAHPFAKSGAPLASGLAMHDPETGVLIAFNAAPGTVAPESQGPYGPYAQALAEMMREGGLPLAEVFTRVRLRVNETTKGADVPWQASNLQTSFVFFERAPDAPPSVAATEQTAAIRSRPIRDLSAQEAYVAALDRDTLQGYLDFIAAYPHDPMAKRARAIVAARREAITWRRSRLDDRPAAYWSYLRRYPRGPHAGDARRRLAFLAAALEPPRSFQDIGYDVPPPPPEEIIYVERPVFVFDDPDFGFAPPPPPPIIFLPPPPPEFIVLPPPPPPVAIFVLPIPVYVPVPVWVRPPPYIEPPPPNVIFNNVHNTVVINNTTNIVTITDRSGQTTTISSPPPAARSGPTAGAPVPSAAVAGPALPPSVAQKASTIQTPGSQEQRAGRSGLAEPQTQPSAPIQVGQPPIQQSQQPDQSKHPGQPQQPAQQSQKPSQSTQPGQPLPGMSGQPLPSVEGTSPGTGKPGQPPLQSPAQSQPQQSGQQGHQPSQPSQQPSQSKQSGQQQQSQPPSQSTQPGKQLPGMRGEPLPSAQGISPGARKPGQPQPPSPAQSQTQQPDPQAQQPSQQSEQPGKLTEPGRLLPGKKGQRLPPVPGTEPRPDQTERPARSERPGEPAKPAQALPGTRGQPLPSTPGFTPGPSPAGQSRPPQSDQRQSQQPDRPVKPEQPLPRTRGQALPSPQMSPPIAPRQAEPERQQQIEQQRRQQSERQRQQMQEMRQQQIQREVEQQRQQQLEQRRQQEVQQQRQQQVEQQRQQQLEQRRQQEMRQQRQQQVEQQRQQQIQRQPMNRGKDQNE